MNELEQLYLTVGGTSLKKAIALQAEAAREQAKKLAEIRQENKTERDNAIPHCAAKWMER